MMMDKPLQGRAWLRGFLAGGGNALMLGALAMERIDSSYKFNACIALGCAMSICAAFVLRPSPENL